MRPSGRIATDEEGCVLAALDERERWAFVDGGRDEVLASVPDAQFAEATVSVVLPVKHEDQDNVWTV